MKTVSTTLLSALNNQSVKYCKKILLYTRSWSAQENKYIFNAPVDITAYLLDISDIKWKLDNEDYSVWNNANTTLLLSNKDGLFTQDNPQGFLPQGSLLYGAKAEVFAGALNAGGQKEYIKIFRGFVLNGGSFQYAERSLSLTLSGELARLSSYPAQDISLMAQGELLTSADSSNFTTAQNAVGEILKIYRGALSGGIAAAQLIKAEQDYQISGLNQYGSPAQIKLTAPLAQGEALWAYYRYWYTDKPMEWIAQEIATRAQSDSYQISSVYYDETVTSALRQPSLTPFSEGTAEYTQVNSQGVQLLPSFLQQAAYNWTVGEKPSNVNFTLTPDSVYLSSGSGIPHATVSAPQTNAYGTWQARADCGWTDQENQWNYFVSSTNSIYTTNGYCFTQDKFDYNLIYCLYKVTAGQMQLIAQVSVRYNYTVNTFRYRISRDEQGNFRLWVRPLTPTLAGDWHAFGIIATDNTHTVSNYQIIDIRYNGAHGISEMKLSPLAATGTGDVGPYGSYLSPVLDGTQNLIAWGQLNIVEQVNLGSSACYYRAKAALGDAWGVWQQLIPNAAPQTNLRYLQLKWRGQSDTAQTSSPVFTAWSLTWQARGVNIALLNTSSMTFLDVMGELARLSGYQIGYDSEGKFLFKPRSSGPAAGTLGKGDILEIESISDGTDKVYTRVSVNFGQFKAVVDPVVLNRPRPNLADKYGIRELSISSGTLLPPQNSNLARAAAPGIYQRVAGVKKRAAVICKFLPQIEPGDILAVSYDGVLNGPMLAEGLEFNLTDWTLRLDLTEF